MPQSQFCDVRCDASYSDDIITPLRKETVEYSFLFPHVQTTKYVITA